MLVASTLNFNYLETQKLHLVPLKSVGRRPKTPAQTGAGGNHSCTVLEFPALLFSRDLYMDFFSQGSSKFFLKHWQRLSPKATHSPRASSSGAHQEQHHLGRTHIFSSSVIRPCCFRKKRSKETHRKHPIIPVPFHPSQYRHKAPVGKGNSSPSQYQDQLKPNSCYWAQSLHIFYFYTHTLLRSLWQSAVISTA